MITETDLPCLEAAFEKAFDEVNPERFKREDVNILLSALNDEIQKKRRVYKNEVNGLLTEFLEKHYMLKDLNPSGDHGNWWYVRRR